RSRAPDATYPRRTCRDCAFGVTKKLAYLRFWLPAFDGCTAIRHGQHLHRYAFTRSRDFFRSRAWFDRSGSRHPMAKIDSLLSGRPGECRKTMGYRTKTNRRGHIYAWWESLLERARARVGDEAAYFQR